MILLSYCYNIYNSKFLILLFIVIILLRFFLSWGRLVQTVKNVNKFINNIVKISETADRKLTYFTKVIKISVNTASIANVDILE